MRQFPARSFLKFFENHGLMRIKGRPQWRTIFGGSREYVRRVLEDARCKVVLNARIASVSRGDEGSTLHFADGREDVFDHVIFACHSDEALRLLADPTADESRLLGNIRYQENEVYLHRDTSFMPRRETTWSSWNYLSASDGTPERSVSLTYWMNRLQSIPTKTPLLVTLNPTVLPARDKTFKAIRYTHPVFDGRAVQAQRELWRLQGVRNTWFCGAYWGYGFHEDGLQSGLAVAEAMGGPARPWANAEPMDRLHWPDHPAWSAAEAAERQWAT
jgi:predicted NAD/FAD-binding protein